MATLATENAELKSLSETLAAQLAKQKVDLAVSKRAEETQATNVATLQAELVELAKQAELAVQLEKQVCPPIH